MSQVIIIHHSEVIREGLAAILRHHQLPLPLLYEKLSRSIFQHIKTDKILLVASRKTTEKAQEQFSDLKLSYLVLEDDDTKYQAEDSYNINLPAQHFVAAVEGFMKQRTHHANHLKLLTDREIEVLKLLSFGHSNKDIADKLFISIHTAISHRKNITEKLGIKSVSGLTVYAIINNLIDTEGLNPEDLI